MSVKIVNTCQKYHKSNPEKIVKNTIDRIPERYLSGLDSILLTEFEDEKCPRMFYERAKSQKTMPRIIVNMASEEYSGIPFFSVFDLNMDLIHKINEHIVKSLQPYSDDKDIQAIKMHRYNPNWVYWGPYNFLLAPINLGIDLVRRIGFINSLFDKFINYLLRNS